MLCFIAALAQASPPPPALPEWGVDDVDLAPDPVAARDSAAPLEGVPSPDIAPQPLVDPPTPPPEGWADADALRIHLSGQAHQRTWLQATARTEEAVAHWQAGPFLLHNESIEVSVDIPEEVRASIVRTGRGYLTLRVAPVTHDGRPFPTRVVGRTPLQVVGDRIVGVPRARWAEVHAEAYLPLAEEVQP